MGFVIDAAFGGQPITASSDAGGGSAGTAGHALELAHDDGYAGLVETHIAAEHRNVLHLVGWDSEGRRRFRIATDLSAKIRSAGTTVLLGEALRNLRVEIGAADQIEHTAEHVAALHVAGRVLIERIRREGVAV